MKSVIKFFDLQFRKTSLLVALCFILLGIILGIWLSWVLWIRPLKTELDGCKVKGGQAMKITGPTIQQQRVTKDQLKNQRPDIIAAAKEQGIKPKQINGYSRSTAEVDIHGEAPIQTSDTTLPGRTDKIKVRSFTMVDSCLNVSATMPVGDSVAYVNIRGSIMMDGFIYWKRAHKFLGIPYGRKQYFNSISTNCPGIKMELKESFSVVRRRTQL